METKNLSFAANDFQQRKKSVLDAIQLPSKEDGYARATLVGASGAGKTSLLRFLAGTTKEKFPATSTGRTTTCNLEMIFSPDPAYEIAVSFMPRQRLEGLLMENIEAAVGYCLQNPDLCSLPDLAEKLLDHRDQTCRLSYMLGDPSLLRNQEEPDEWDEEELLGFAEAEEPESSVPSDDVQRLAKKIGAFLQQVLAIADSFSQADPMCREGLCLDQDAQACQLRDDMVKEIAGRFSLLKDSGRMLGWQQGWADGWYYTSSDRADFIETAKQFSDNAKKSWGRLFTPLVDSIRIKGSFKPAFMEDVPLIVLFDGQGVGHRTMAPSSIPSDIRSYFAISDTIILVDNAEQPVLENARLTLKTVIETGKADHLVVAFTHMDRMEGDNFSSVADKVKHIRQPLYAYLDELERFCSEAERQAIRTSCLYFFALDKVCTANSAASQKSTEKLLGWMQRHRQACTCAEDINLFYDMDQFVAALRQAIRSYRYAWGDKLAVEHWTRIKALTKRLGYCGQDNYNNVLQELQKSFNQFIRQPVYCKPTDAAEKVKLEQMKAILQDMERATASFVYNTMWKREDQLRRWQEAYEYRGYGSTDERRKKIREIFEIPAPLFLENNNTAADAENLVVLCRVIRDVLKRHNASLLMERASN